MTHITSVERFLTRARSSAPTRLVMLPSAKMADPIALPYSQNLWRPSPHSQNLWRPSPYSQNLWRPSQAAVE